MSQVQCNQYLGTPGTLHHIISEAVSYEFDGDVFYCTLSDPSLPTLSMRLGYVIRGQSHNLKWLLEWGFLPKVLYHKLKWTEKSLRNSEQEFTSSSLFVLPMKKQTQRQTIRVFSEGSYEARWRQDFLSFQSQALYTTPVVLKEGKWGRGPQTGSISITWELVGNPTSQAPSQA